MGTRSIRFDDLCADAVTLATSPARGAPALPLGTPEDAAILARINHLGYYVLLLMALPVIGWCACSQGGFGPLHIAGAIVLMLAIVAHLAGVAYHRWFRHDGLLQRMLPA